ncbi:MAG TPA: S41 family peptidase, partial [Pedobacter sp.]
LKYKDSIWVVDLKEPLRKTTKKPDSLNRERKIVKKIKSQPAIKKAKPAKIEGKTLKFLEPDSSVALITIRNFMQGNYQAFYSRSFKSIKHANTKYLIIDLRDNGGGRLSDATSLYSYLADTAFRMTSEFELTSRVSISKTLPAVIPKMPLYPKPVLKAMATLFAFPINMYVTLQTRKHGNSYLYSTKYSNLVRPQKDNFKGKIYVLINGGTFSASTIVSANLKGTNRALFVGEETGGAFNGCVAGLLPILDLPKSKLNLRFGIFHIQPDHLSRVEGRGIFPDQEIKISLSDRLKKIDAELSWVLRDIKRKNDSQTRISQETLQE